MLPVRGLCALWLPTQVLQARSTIYDVPKDKYRTRAAAADTSHHTHTHVRAHTQPLLRPTVWPARAPLAPSGIPPARLAGTVALAAQCSPPIPPCAIRTCKVLVVHPRESDGQRRGQW